MWRGPSPATPRYRFEAGSGSSLLCKFEEILQLLRVVAATGSKIYFTKLEE